MGCASSSDMRETMPHLVIVGFQFGGYNLLQQVKDKFRVTVIDKKDFFEWTCAAPASIHQEGNFERISTSYDEAINAKKVFGSKVKFVQGLVSELVDAHNLKYVPTKGKTSGHPGSGAKGLRFDYLAICTGSVWAANHSAEDLFNIFSSKEKSAYYSKYREEIDKANSVLVVGGGPTGVEIAGEILIKYKGQKKLGIATNSSKLIEAYGDKAAEMAKDHFEEKGVELHFNTRYDPSSDLAKEYNYVINCVGTKVLTPFLDKSFSDFKNERGQIFINEYYQITNENPLTGAVKDSRKVYDNIFAFGDCSLSKLNEPKNIPACVSASIIVANNLVKSLEDKESEFKKVPEQNFFLSGVYFDDTAGAFVMGGDTNLNPNLYNDKKGYEHPYFTFLKDEPEGQKNYDGYLKMFTG